MLNLLQSHRQLLCLAGILPSLHPSCFDVFRIDIPVGEEEAVGI